MNSRHRGGVQLTAQSSSARADLDLRGRRQAVRLPIWHFDRRIFLRLRVRERFSRCELRAGVDEQFGNKAFLSRADRGGLGKFEGAKSRSIGQINARKVASSSGIGVAAQIGFGSVISKCEFMPREKIFERGPGSVKLHYGLAESRLAFHHLRKPPVKL